MKINISQHALNRARIRLSMGEETFTDVCNKAYAYGIGIAHAPGKLKSFLYRKTRGYANARSRVVFYGAWCFIFVENNLITVYGVPPKLLL